VFNSLINQPVILKYNCNLILHRPHATVKVICLYGFVLLPWLSLLTHACVCVGSTARSTRRAVDGLLLLLRFSLDRSVREDRLRRLSGRVPGRYGSALRHVFRVLDASDHSVNSKGRSSDIANMWANPRGAVLGPRLQCHWDA
jgi:hypothetical protein